MQGVTRPWQSWEKPPGCAWQTRRTLLGMVTGTSAFSETGCGLKRLHVVFFAEDKPGKAGRARQWLPVTVLGPRSPGASSQAVLGWRSRRPHSGTQAAGAATIPTGCGCPGGGRVWHLPGSAQRRRDRSLPIGRKCPAPPRPGEPGSDSLLDVPELVRGQHRTPRRGLARLGRTCFPA